MSDDLVKRAREAWKTGDDWEAMVLLRPTANRIEELEAKLERAVEALGGMIDLFSEDNVLRKGTHLNMEISNARTTLAELKGETDERT